MPIETVPPPGGALTTAQLDQVGNYLKAKYQLAWAAAS
jgi:hypothetical protein